MGTAPPLSLGDGARSQVQSHRGGGERTGLQPVSGHESCLCPHTSDSRGLKLTCHVQAKKDRQEGKPEASGLCWAEVCISK